MAGGGDAGVGRDQRRGLFRGQRDNQLVAFRQRPGGDLPVRHGLREWRLRANSGSGTTNASGSGSDTYNYQELFSYSPATKQWTPTGGSGSASGSGSATFRLSAVGGYSGIDPTWAYDESGYNEGGAADHRPGQRLERHGLFLRQRHGGLRLLDQLHLLDHDRPVDHQRQRVGDGQRLDEHELLGQFAFRRQQQRRQRQHLLHQRPRHRQRLGLGQLQLLGRAAAFVKRLGALSSGSGGASGGSSATWSYAGGNADGGDDTYSQTKDGGTVSGTLGESGSQTYNTGYNGTAAVASGAWTQTGTGDANGTDTYNYGYSGSGSGASRRHDLARHLRVRQRQRLVRLRQSTDAQRRHARERLHAWSPPAARRRRILTPTTPATATAAAKTGPRRRK